jgi:hypothetical protein
MLMQYYAEEQVDPEEYARVSTIVNQMAQTFGTSVPEFRLGEEMPNGVLAFYTTEDRVLHFGDTRPFVVAHESAHHVHTYFNIPCSREVCEKFARMLEEWYVRSSAGYAAAKPEIEGFARHDYSFCGNCSVYYQVGGGGGGGSTTTTSGSSVVPYVWASGIMASGVALAYFAKKL